MIRFALLSALAVVVVTGAALLVGERIARSMALDDARHQGDVLATQLVAPLVDRDVRSGIPGATDRLDAAVADRMQDGDVRHVKVWDARGTVLWSDQQQIVGRTFALSDDVSELFESPGTVARVTDLTRPENVAESEERRLLEVYAGAMDSTGEPVVVEAYLATSTMEADTRTVVASFLALVVGSLLLLLLLMLPLAVALGRRVERAQRDRTTMMHALLASELERRRLAEDLHHGVVQELAGLGYALPTVRRYLDDGPDLDAARSLLDRATELVQRNVSALRGLMTDVYPPDLDAGGLKEGVQQLVHVEAVRAGIHARLHLDDHLDLPPETARLAYRVVREGVRNVVKHSGAATLLVELRTDGTQVLVRVVDDGRGPGDRPGHSPRGHLGLRLLTDTVGDVGGRVEVQACTEAGLVTGTELVASFPHVPVMS